MYNGGKTYPVQMFDGDPEDRPVTPGGHKWQCKCRECCIFWDTDAGMHLYVTWVKEHGRPKKLS